MFLFDESTLFSLKLSLKVSFFSTLFVLIVGIIIAYILARKSFFGKEFLDILFTLPLVFPPTVTGYYLILLFGRNGYIGKSLYAISGFSFMFSWQGAVLASFVVSIPLMIKTSRAAIESVDSHLINVSYSLGRSEFDTAIKIILPLSKKGIIAGAILSFARSMGEFGATLMIAGNIPGKTNTMPLAIYTYNSSGDYREANILVIFFTLISGSFLYLANRLTKKVI
ncbi:MAG: molybdate ABC transporter permease subunit [Leptospiraceae bacterium]|nr:molybdate ABC transporter permease subunit [Leptospiraceae bacterium]MCP5499470.1 molybdate ABC transporter permease subunit [Leptospiraceae bacterium]